MKSIALGSLGVMVAILVVLRCQPFFGYGVPEWLALTYIPVFFVFALTHSIVRMGVVWTGGFWVLSAVVPYTAEWWGIRTGFPFGRYYYTGELGLKVGGVPVIIPLAWFMMLYGSYCLALRLIPRTVSQRPPWCGRCLRASLAAYAMMAWDLVIDPTSVAMKNWVWMDGGAYLGIPLQNFAGWFGTALIIFYVVERLLSGGEALPTRKGWFRELPVLVYFLVFANNILSCLQWEKPLAAFVGTVAVAPLVILAGVKSYQE